MRPYIILFTGVISVSFAAIFIRLAEAPPLVVATYRMVIAAAVVVPVALTRSRKSLTTLARRDLFWLLLSGVFLALHFGLWITSLDYTSIASSVVLVTSHPAFVAVVSYLIWGEKPGRRSIAGIAIALVGVVLINYGGFTFSSQAILGDWLALAAGFAMGAYLIIGGRLRERIDILSYLSVIYTFSAVILLTATLFSGHSFLGYSPVTYVMMLLLALVPQLIGHSCLNLAVRLLPVIMVSVAILGEPVGATLLGFIILGEAPTVNEIAGGILVLSGIFTVMQGSQYRA